MKYIFGYLFKKLGLNYLLIAISVFYFSAVIAFYVFIVNSLITFYGLIQYFLDLISNSSNYSDNVNSISDTIYMFNSLLDTIGFYPALEDTMPLIISSITFMITKILWAMTLRTYTLIVRQLLSVGSAL